MPILTAPLAVGALNVPPAQYLPPGQVSHVHDKSTVHFKYCPAEHEYVLSVLFA